MCIYVDAAAKAGGDGSKEKPFATINEAKFAARIVQKESGYPEDGIVIKIAEGDYMPESFVDSSHPEQYLWLQPKSDNGQEGAPLVFEGAGDVRIIGGIKADLENNFVPTVETDLVYGENIVKYQAPKGTFSVESLPLSGTSKPNSEFIDYDATPYFSVLFNEEYMTLARWPDNGYATISEVFDEGYLDMENKTDHRGFEFTSDLITDEKLKQWENENIMIHGYWDVDFLDFGTPACVTEKGLKSLYPADYSTEFSINRGPSNDNLTDRRFYVENSPSELDMPGEWYIDNVNDVLYFYPPKENGEVIISTIKTPVVHLDGVKHVTLKNLKILGGRNYGIAFSGCNNIVIDDCTVNGSGLVGIDARSTSRTTIKNSEILNTGTGGINLWGGTRRLDDSGNPVVGGNIAINNKIHDYSRVDKCYAYALSLSGYKNTARNNEIYNGEHAAVYLSGWDLEFSYNDIHNVLSEASDMGAIYYGKSKSRRGNIIEYNYFHDLKTSSKLGDGKDISAVFMDDVSDGYIVRYNIFENIDGRAFRTNGGRDHTVTNNVFLNTYINSYFTRTAGPKYEAYIIGDPVIANNEHRLFTEYPHLPELLEDDPIEPKYNVFKNNFTYGHTYDLITDGGKEQPTRDYMVNYLSCDFVDSEIIDSEMYEKIMADDYSDFGINFSNIGINW